MQSYENLSKSSRGGGSLVKLRKLFRVLALTMTLATIGAIIPATPAMAANPVISIYPNIGPVGTTVYIEGQDFTAGTARIRIDSPNATNEDTFTIPSGGDFAGVGFEIPNDLSGGEHDIYVWRSSLEYASYPFTVTPQLTDMDPDTGKVGDSIHLEGNGFVSTSAQIWFYWDDTHVSTITGSAVNSNGILSANVAVPASIRGDHQLYLEDRRNGNYQTESVIFTVESKLAVAPTSGGVGDTLTVTGTGFAGGAVSIFFDSTVVGTATVPISGATAGSFTATITVPQVGSGTHIIKAVDTEEIQTTFTLSQQITVTPNTPVSVGDNVTITGDGFAINQPVAISIDNIPVTITPIPYTTASGSFMVTFPVPATAKGAHTLSVKVGTGTPSTETITIKEKIVGELRPSNGPGGTVVKVSGTGFTPGQAAVNFDGVTIGTIIVDSYGSFTDATFTVPDSSSGAHAITIQGVAAPSFTIDPKMSLTPAAGVFNDVITVTGSGFGAQKTISVVIDGAYSLGTATSNSSGEFTATFTVPNLPKGSHTVKASDSESKSAETQLTINQQFTLGAATGKAGDRVSVLGTGFAANRQITLSFGGTAVTTEPAAINTDQYGSFSGYFTVPPAVAGAITISASDGANQAAGNFTNEATASLSVSTSSQNPGYVGLEVTVTGFGFKASSSVSVSFDSDTAATATGASNTQGSFSITFKVPAIAKGSHTIKVSDGITTKEFDFVMEGTAPAVPVLVTPATASKPQQPVAFTWNAVTDPSSVTYEFQLSQDATFATIIQEETGLTTPNFTLAEEPKLPSASGNTAYQWRVRAVDGAGNASAWSTTNTFSIGMVWPSWLIHVWYGLGILVALVLGLFFGRRMAYQSY